jgi:hypothetical protein
VFFARLLPHVYGGGRSPSPLVKPSMQAQTHFHDGHANRGVTYIPIPRSSPIPVTANYLCAAPFPFAL